MLWVIVLFLFFLFWQTVRIFPVSFPPLVLIFSVRIPAAVSVIDYWLSSFWSVPWCDTNPVYAYSSKLPSRTATPTPAGELDSLRRCFVCVWRHRWDRCQKMQRGGLGITSSACRKIFIKIWSLESRVRCDVGPPGQLPLCLDVDSTSLWTVLGMKRYSLFWCLDDGAVGPVWDQVTVKTCFTSERM